MCLIRYVVLWVQQILATLVLMMLFTFEEELLLAYTAARETVGSKSVVSKLTEQNDFFGAVNPVGP
jgi:hypothetical protein